MPALRLRVPKPPTQGSRRGSEPHYPGSCGQSMGGLGEAPRQGRGWASALRNEAWRSSKKLFPSAANQ